MWDFLKEAVPEWWLGLTNLLFFEIYHLPRNVEKVSEDLSTFFIYFKVEITWFLITFGLFLIGIFSIFFRQLHIEPYYRYKTVSRSIMYILYCLRFGVFFSWFCSKLILFLHYNFYEYQNYSIRLLKISDFFYGDLFVFDSFSLALKLLCFFMFIVLFLFLNKVTKVQRIYKFEYIFVLYCFLGFILLLVISFNLFLTYFLIEITSLLVYLLLILHKGFLKSGVSADVALRYFILNTLTFSFFNVGSMFLYGSGFVAMHYHTFKFYIYSFLNFGMVYIPLLTHAGAFLVIICLLFKLGAAPLALWVPDIYDQAPTSLVFMLSGLFKVTLASVLLRLVYYSFCDLSLFLEIILAIFGVCSLFWGALGALVQRRLKRFYAYSSIAHMGYFLLAVSALHFFSLYISILYLYIYILGLIAFFYVVLNLQLNYFNKLKRTVLFFSDLKDLWYSSPTLSFLFTIALLSWAGLPPFAGFFSKFYLLLFCVNFDLLNFVLVIFLASILGFFYYFRILQSIFFVSKKYFWTNSYIFINNFFSAKKSEEVAVNNDDWQYIHGATEASHRAWFYIYDVFFVEHPGFRHRDMAHWNEYILEYKAYNTHEHRWFNWRGFSRFKALHANFGEFLTFFIVFKISKILLFFMFYQYNFFSWLDIYGVVLSLVNTASLSVFQSIKFDIFNSSISFDCLMAGSLFGANLFESTEKGKEFEEYMKNKKISLYLVEANFPVIGPGLRWLVITYAFLKFVTGKTTIIYLICPWNWLTIYRRTTSEQRLVLGTSFVIMFGWFGVFVYDVFRVIRWSGVIITAPVAEAIDRLFTSLATKTGRARYKEYLNSRYGYVYKWGRWLFLIYIFPINYISYHSVGPVNFGILWKTYNIFFIYLFICYLIFWHYIQGKWEIPVDERLASFINEIYPRKYSKQFKFTYFDWGRNIDPQHYTVYPALAIFWVMFCWFFLTVPAVDMFYTEWWRYDALGKRQNVHLLLNSRFSDKILDEEMKKTGLFTKSERMRLLEKRSTLQILHNFRKPPRLNEAYASWNNYVWREMYENSRVWKDAWAKDIKALTIPSATEMLLKHRRYHTHGLLGRLSETTSSMVRNADMMVIPEPAGGYVQYRDYADLNGSPPIKDISIFYDFENNLEYGYFLYLFNLYRVLWQGVRQTMVEYMVANYSDMNGFKLLQDIFADEKEDIIQVWAGRFLDAFCLQKASNSRKLLPVAGLRLSSYVYPVVWFDFYSHSLTGYFEHINSTATDVLRTILTFVLRMNSWHEGWYKETLAGKMKHLNLIVYFCAPNDPYNHRSLLPTEKFGGWFAQTWPLGWLNHYHYDFKERSEHAQFLNYSWGTISAFDSWNIYWVLRSFHESSRDLWLYFQKRTHGIPLFGNFPIKLKDVFKLSNHLYKDGAAYILRRTDVEIPKMSEIYAQRLRLASEYKKRPFISTLFDFTVYGWEFIEIEKLYRAGLRFANMYSSKAWNTDRLQSLLELGLKRPTVDFERIVWTPAIDPVFDLHCLGDNFDRAVMRDYWEYFLMVYYWTALEDITSWMDEYDLMKEFIDVNAAAAWTRLVDPRCEDQPDEWFDFSQDVINIAGEPTDETYEKFQKHLWSRDEPPEVFDEWVWWLEDIYENHEYPLNLYQATEFSDVIELYEFFIAKITRADEGMDGSFYWMDLVDDKSNVQEILEEWWSIDPEDFYNPSYWILRPSMAYTTAHRILRAEPHVDTEDLQLNWFARNHSPSTVPWESLRTDLKWDRLNLWKDWYHFPTIHGLPESIDDLEVMLNRTNSPLIDFNPEWKELKNLPFFQFKAFLDFNGYEYWNLKENIKQNMIKGFVKNTSKTYFENYFWHAVRGYHFTKKNYYKFKFNIWLHEFVKQEWNFPGSVLKKWSVWIGYYYDWKLYSFWTNTKYHEWFQWFFATFFTWWFADHYDLGVWVLWDEGDWRYKLDWRDPFNFGSLGYLWGAGWNIKNLKDLSGLIEDKYYLIYFDLFADKDLCKKLDPLSTCYTFYRIYKSLWTYVFEPFLDYIILPLEVYIFKTPEKQFKWLLEHKQVPLWVYRDFSKYPAMYEYDYLPVKADKREFFINNVLIPKNSNNYLKLWFDTIKLLFTNCYWGVRRSFFGTLVWFKSTQFSQWAYRVYDDVVGIPRYGYTEVSGDYCGNYMTKFWRDDFVDDWRYVVANRDYFQLLRYRLAFPFWESKNFFKKCFQVIKFDFKMWWEDLKIRYDLLGNVNEKFSRISRISPKVIASQLWQMRSVTNLEHDSSILNWATPMKSSPVSDVLENVKMAYRLFGPMTYSKIWADPWWPKINYFFLDNIYTYNRRQASQNGVLVQPDRWGGQYPATFKIARSSSKGPVVLEDYGWFDTTRTKGYIVGHLMRTMPEWLARYITAQVNYKAAQTFLGYRFNAQRMELEVLHCPKILEEEQHFLAEEERWRFRPERGLSLQQMYYLTKNRMWIDKVRRNRWDYPSRYGEILKIDVDFGKYNIRPKLKYVKCHVNPFDLRLDFLYEFPESYSEAFSTTLADSYNKTFYFEDIENKWFVSCGYSNKLVTEADFNTVDSFFLKHTNAWDLMLNKKLPFFFIKGSTWIREKSRVFSTLLYYWALSEKFKQLLDLYEKQLWKSLNEFIYFFVNKYNRFIFKIVSIFKKIENFFKDRQPFLVFLDDHYSAQLSKVYKTCYNILSIFVNFIGFIVYTSWLLWKSSWLVYFWYQGSLKDFNIFYNSLHDNLIHKIFFAYYYSGHYPKISYNFLKFFEIPVSFSDMYWFEIKVVFDFYCFLKTMEHFGYKISLFENNPTWQNLNEKVTLWLKFATPGTDEFNEETVLQGISTMKDQILPPRLNTFDDQVGVRVRYWIILLVAKFYEKMLKKIPYEPVWGHNFVWAQTWDFLNREGNVTSAEYYLFLDLLRFGRLFGFITILHEYKKGLDFFWKQVEEVYGENFIFWLKKVPGYLPKGSDPVLLEKSYDLVLKYNFVYPGVYKTMNDWMMEESYEKILEEPIKRTFLRTHLGVQWDLVDQYFLNNSFIFESFKFMCQNDEVFDAYVKLLEKDRSFFYFYKDFTKVCWCATYLM